MVKKNSTLDQVHPNVTSNIFERSPHSKALTSELPRRLHRLLPCLHSSLFLDLWHLLVYGPRIKKACSQQHTEKGKQSTVRALNIQLEERGEPRKSEAACQSFILHYWLALKQIICSWMGSNVATENSRGSRQWRVVSFPATWAGWTHFVTTNSYIMGHVAVPLLPLLKKVIRIQKNTQNHWNSFWCRSSCWDACTRCRRKCLFYTADGGCNIYIYMRDVDRKLNVKSCMMYSRP